MTALVAENDPSVRGMLRRLMGSFCSIVEAETYREITDLARGEKFDIAAIDVMLDDGGMPDCIASVKMLRERMKGIVIVVWSGFMQDAQSRKSLLDAGADGFLEKGAGFTVETLYQMLLDALQRRAARGELDAASSIAIIEQCAKIKASNL